MRAVYLKKTEVVEQMQTFKETRDECGSVILALVYFFFKGVVDVTMLRVYRIVGVKQENQTLLNAEKFLVATTLLMISLVTLSQYIYFVGWIAIVFGNIRILQIISINFLTLIFDFTPSSDHAARKKRARWHFLGIAFSLFDILLAFAFMYQFFDLNYHIFDKHFDEIFSYFYIAIAVASTVGGDVMPVSLFGRMLICYEIIIAISVIIFLLSGIMGRFQSEFKR